MPKVLVIAGTSFIGRHICEQLREIGCEVVATARRAAADSQTTFCDLTDGDSVEAAVRNTAPDWIIQCGGATSSRDPRELYRTHIDGTLNVLDAAHRFVPDAAICVFGSAAEYGPVPADRLPVPENCPCQPPTFFGASKLAQTQLAQAAAATHGQKIVIVRPFNVIGPGLPDFYFASSLARRLLQLKAKGAPPGTPFDIVNADSTRDFIDARDVASAVAALLRCLTSNPSHETGLDAAAAVPSGSIFNLATGVETSLVEVARLLGELAGHYVPEPAGSADSRGGIVRSVGSARSLTAATSWRPEFAWQQSIHDLWLQIVSGH